MAEPSKRHDAPLETAPAETLRDTLGDRPRPSTGPVVGLLLVGGLALVLAMVFLFWLSRENPEQLEPVPNPQQLPGAVPGNAP